MLFSVDFYALSGEQFATTLRNPSAELKEKLQQFLQGRLTSNLKALPPIWEAAESIFRGEVPRNAPQEFFDALFAILEVTAEHISISSFQDFNYSGFLDDTEIWPWFEQDVPPFPMPRGAEIPPAFGYASVNLLREVVLPGIQQLPPCDDARIARNQFAEIAESVADDGLDLVAYFTVW